MTTAKLKNLSLGDNIFNELFEILSEEEVILDNSSYRNNTINIKRNINFIIKPLSSKSIPSILKVLDKYSMKVYPVSTGNNWGYGTSLPISENNVILDLSKLNKIEDFNSELGYIRLEPGVTQGQLYEYLKQNNFDFLVPTTGAGPDCSIIGNLLERGYGITPHQDHIVSLLSLEAILADGSIYNSPLKKLGGELLDSSFKWGIGPYLDGIFTQSNFAIVTKATISLVPSPKSLDVFVFELDDPNDLSNAVEDIRQILNELGGIIGGINLMNNRRVLSMQTAYIKNQQQSEGILSDEIIRSLAKKEGVSEWIGVGAFYKNKDINKAAWKSAKKILKKKNRKIHFFNKKKATILSNIVSWLPRKFFGKYQGLMNNLLRLFELFGGKPTRVAHSLCYLKSEKLVNPDQPINPANDECGLIWYSPLVPMVSEKVCEYVEFVKHTCGKYGIEPLITLTSLSEKCFDSTVPIVFRREENGVDETLKAHNCYNELLREGQKRGFFPYRMGINHMNSIVDPNETSWKISSAIKDALDPNNTISPGRYNKK